MGKAAVGSKSRASVTGGRIKQHPLRGLGERAAFIIDGDHEEHSLESRNPGFSR